MEDEDDQKIPATPEMIEAGVAVLFKWCGEFDFERLPSDELRQFVREILFAALKAR